MRIQYPVGADLAAQAEIFSEGRENQFYSSGIEAYAVVQNLYAVFSIDAFDSHHSFEDTFVGDLCRVAGEQRVQHVRCRAFDDIVNPVSRDIDSWQFVNNLVDLENYDALVEFGCFNDSWCIFSGETGVDVAFSISCISGNEETLGTRSMK